MCGEGRQPPLRGLFNNRANCTHLERTSLQEAVQPTPRQRVASFLHVHPVMAPIDLRGTSRCGPNAAPSSAVAEHRFRCWHSGARAIGWSARLWLAIRNPLVLLLGLLGAFSAQTGDLRAASAIGVMIAVGAALRFVQESRADAAASALKAMGHVSAHVTRDGQPREIPVREVVPGDVITLAAGLMMPADIRLISAKDVFVGQSIWSHGGSAHKYRCRRTGCRWERRSKRWMTRRSTLRWRLRVFLRDSRPATNSA